MTILTTRLKGASERGQASRLCSLSCINPLCSYIRLYLSPLSLSLSYTRYTSHLLHVTERSLVRVRSGSIGFIFSTLLFFASLLSSSDAPSASFLLMAPKSHGVAIIAAERRCRNSREKKEDTSKERGREGGKWMAVFKGRGRPSSMHAGNIAPLLVLQQSLLRHFGADIR